MHASPWSQLALLAQAGVHTGAPWSTQIAEGPHRSSVVSQASPRSAAWTHAPPAAQASCASQSVLGHAAASQLVWQVLPAPSSKQRRPVAQRFSAGAHTAPSVKGAGGDG